MKALLLAALVLPGAALAANGQWVSAPGPAGYSGQLNSIVSSPKGNAIYLSGGLTGVWSAPLPLGSAPAYTAYPSTGLGGGWFVDSLSATALGGAPLISFFPYTPPSNRGLLRYFDSGSQSWMQVAPNPINFGGVAKLALLTNGDLIASEADSLFASTDNGLNWTLRTNISSSMTAPPPLPVGGNVVGKPAYGTNAVTPTLPGYSEAFNSMPWGEVFLGTEVHSMWHSYDYGNTWEHIDPLFFEPIRDQSGVPLWINPHLTYFGSGGNTVGAGFTKDAEILLNATAATAPTSIG